MRQGMLALLLLSSFTLTSPAAYGIAMPAKEVQQWRHSVALNAKTDELFEQIVRNETDSVNFALQRLNQPQQEVVRFKLLRKIEQSHLVLTLKSALFIEAQLAFPPSYHLIEQGDGYEVRLLAFDSAAVANRLLNRWKQDEQILAFILDVEQQRLDLHQWLSDENKALKQRHEHMLVSEIEHLSHESIQVLADQVTKANITSWLPSTSVMVALARYSGDPTVYQMLWRMRADHNMRNELLRLSAIEDRFSLQQIMAATDNPSLKGVALAQLTEMKPLPDEVKQFLIARMAMVEEAPLVAQSLAEQGHAHWLKELVESNTQVSIPALQKVLAQSF